MKAFRDAFDTMTGPEGVTPALVEEVLGSILAGEWTPVQVAGFAVGLRVLGETPEVFAAAAKALRTAMIPVAHDATTVLDTCGTGGDGRGTLNVSTGAAILAAAAGVVVAKHGNRAVSSRSGSADVLEALGIPIDLPPSAGEVLLREIGIAFLMAPVHHPAMRHAAVARKELGIRTIFNGLGPLANPAGATHQLLGTYDDGLRRALAETLRELGSVRAWVVRSEDGLDEVSPFAPTRVTELSGGSLEERVVSPETFGLQRCGEGALDGGEASHNAAILERVLRGERHPSRDAFVLNAAAALVVAEGVAPIAARDRIVAVLDDGSAARKLEAWRTAAARVRDGAS